MGHERQGGGERNGLAGMKAHGREGRVRDIPQGDVSWTH